SVVFRMCWREHAVTVIGGGDGVPFVIRREDLPPMPAEPLFDLAVLDRTLRPRALLQPRSAGDQGMLRFPLRPPHWAAGMPEMNHARRDGDGWTLLARDDAPLDLVATALRHQQLPVTVPARQPGIPLPVLPLVLQPH